MSLKHVFFIPDSVKRLLKTNFRFHPTEALTTWCSGLCNYFDFSVKERVGACFLWMRFMFPQNIQRFLQPSQESRDGRHRQTLSMLLMSFLADHLPSWLVVSKAIDTRTKCSSPELPYFYAKASKRCVGPH